MLKNNIEKRMLLSITGKTQKDWVSKLEEIKKYKINTVALFLEHYKIKQRKKIYNELLKSSIKKIPLVHIKNDMRKWELKFLIEKFNSQYLTIHESSFNILEKWKGYYKKLYLEMNYDNYLPSNVKVEKIGGFCLDLSHFKSSEESWTKEFFYMINKNKKYFKCNHLNGYSYEKNTDLHTIKNLAEFNYLKTLPNFIFGRAIALETFNNLNEQIKFKRYIINLLKDR